MRDVGCHHFVCCPHDLIKHICKRCNGGEGGRVRGWVIIALVDEVSVRQLIGAAAAAVRNSVNMARATLYAVTLLLTPIMDRAAGRL